MRVPLYPFATPVRDYSEMARRYTHMFVCPDLVKVVFKWAQVRKGGEGSVETTSFRERCRMIARMISSQNQNCDCHSPKPIVQAQN